MPDTTPFSHKERSGLKLLGTPVLMTVVDEATGEKSVKEREAFVPAWKQTVTDEQGRRRFHGAFTGGFSAGYFNSVGSKEGWTPASFTSSREARAVPQQSVADFMDEDDVAAGVAAASVKKDGGSAAPASVEHAMARLLERVPDEKNEGLVLMRKWGWRDGQGVGPLVRLGGGAAPRERSEEPAPKRATFGPALSREEIDEIRNAPVAPRDIVVPTFEVKNDTHGLGYDPYLAAPEFAVVAAAAAAAKGRTGAQAKKPSRVAFGLGALEEADDFDPFGQDDVAQFDRTLGERPAEPPLRRRETQEAPVEGDERLCSDGRPPLPGFELGPVLVDKVEANRLVVPPGWKPGPLVCENVLGDAQVPPALAKWALSQARKAALEMATRQQQQVQVKPEPVRAPSPPRPVAPVANAMTPFPTDPAKQSRYQNWLVAQTGFEGVWGNQARPSAEEIVEFEAVRAKFAAVPKGMSDRFAPAGAVVEVKNEEELRAEEFRKYGIGTTRTEEDWAPVGLLCRRWGVKDPFADGRRAKPESKSSGGAADIFPSLTKELEKQFGASYHAQMELAEAQAAARAEELAARMKQENPDETVVPEVRPEDDVFAAIFERPSELKAEEPAEATPVSALVAPVAATRPTVIDVDAFVARSEKPKRERAEDADEPSSVLASIFGPGVVKKSKTVELLDKTSVVKEFVSGAILGDDKSKKKKKKNDKKTKKGKKKKEKKSSKKST